MLENKPISKQCDVYSYGIVVWELLTHKIPFEEAGTDHELHKMVVMDKKVSVYWFSVFFHLHLLIFAEI